MADGSSSVQSTAPLGAPLGEPNDIFSSTGVSPEAKCGIVLIGHGNTASTMLEAARSIVPDSLGGVIAIDAGAGQTPELVARVCAAVEQVDEGRGILLVADLMGSSPCMCGLRQSVGEGKGQKGQRGFALVTGLNLAMLTKLAVADRHGDLCELAEACADSARRSVCVKIHEPQD
jgi:PTS system mannose-specific IIA component